ncbi:MAG: efflux RND transporter permease subunit [Bacteroidales bacterium]|nr:efflux RND transporter permease subunit [Bacteroidales bacterium]
MKGKSNLIEWAMKHYSIVFLLVALMVAFGIISLKVMPKQEFPAYTIRQGVIIGIYPGATSEEVEKQLAEPLERFLFTYPEVKRGYTTTTSQNGMCYVMVELNDNVDNKDEVWSKIKHGLVLLKQSLPQGVLALVAQDDFGDTSALLVAIESGTRSYKELKEYTDELSDRLRRIESVSNLRLYGEQKEQITVYVNRDKLSSYGISDNLLTVEFFTQSLAPGGSIKNDDTEIPVHLAPTYSGLEEVEDQIIYSDGGGNMIRVKDVARVVRENPGGKSYITYNGNRCLVLSVEMRNGYNVVKFGKDVDQVMNEYIRTVMPDDVNVCRITDQAQIVGDSVNSFLRDLVMAIIVIIVVMLLLFPLRSALVAAIVIPLNTFISVGIMYLAGIPLNTVTLAALIVVLGMVVDNAIVIIDGYLFCLNNGDKPWDAAVESARKYFQPMALATLCICLIFYPFLFLFKGMMLEFVVYFPLTITINLMVSLAIAVLVIPILEVMLIKPKKEGESGNNRFTDKVHGLYMKLLGSNFRHPWLTLGFAIASIIVATLLATKINFRMMPTAERNQFAVEIHLPDGAPINQTAQVADSLRRMLARDKRVKSITTFVGMSSPRFHTSYAPQMPSDAYSQFIVNTGSGDDTEALLNAYTDYYAHYFPNAYVKFKQLDFNAVATFEFRFYGENAEDLKVVAKKLEKKMREIPELTNVHTDWGDPIPVMDVTLDPVASSQVGATRGITAANLAMATNGITMGSVTENNDNIPIVLKTDEKKGKTTLEDVSDIYVSTFVPTVTVPLRQIATVAPVWGENKIVHRDGMRTITVTTDTKRGVLPGKALSYIQDVIAREIVPALPRGVNYQVGGQPEYNKDNLTPVLYVIISALVVIFFFLLFTYGKFGLTLISMFTLSLFMFGAVFGLWISGMTVGLTSALGLVGLFGITIRNVILMFQHAEQRFVIDGWLAKDAAFDAGKRRMIPIFLTSAAASVGVVPMIMSGSSWWAPVGMVIFAGGFFLLFMTITVLPVLYWKLNDKKK